MLALGAAEAQRYAAIIFSRGKIFVKMTVYPRTAAFILLLSFCVSGQENDSEDLLPFVQNGKMGYIDKTGKIIIPPQFDTSSFMGIPDLSKFSEGLSPVKARGKVGYIDTSGKIVIAPQFKEARNFSGGLAAVKIADKWGYVDKKGAIVISPQFKDVWRFSEGLAQVEIEGKWGYIDKTGKVVIDPQFGGDQYPDFNVRESGVFKDGIANVRSGRQYLYIDHRGKIIGKCILECLSNFYEGLSVVQRLGAGGWLMGYMERNGVIAIEPKFGAARKFSEGLAPVKYGLKGYHDTYLGVYGTDKKLWYYIDKTGERAFQGDYVWAGYFSEGLAPVGRDTGNKTGYIDRLGRMVIKARFDRAGSFKGGVARVLIGTKWGYIDKSGNYVWEPSK